MKRRLKNKIIKYSMAVDSNPYGIDNRDYSIKTDKSNVVSISITKQGLAKLPNNGEATDIPGISFTYLRQGCHSARLFYSNHKRYYNRP